MTNKHIIILLLCLFIFRTNQAQFRLPEVIGSNMVLQQNKKVPVWGFANAGEKVTVKLANQVKTAVSDHEGHWLVYLNPMKASFKPVKMVVSTKDTSITLQNILIGEVWFCSGQSNMEYMMYAPKYSRPTRSEDLSAKELQTAHNPAIRVFLVEKKLSTPDVSTNGWNIAQDSALMPFSAIGYWFGKEINSTLNVPVGIISSSWGGSRIEPWTPSEAYTSSPVFREDVLRDSGKLDGMATGKNFTHMIKPLIPFAVRGFLWYQGESNCMLNETLRYKQKMEVLISSWRNLWNDASLPFYYVQIAPYYYTKRKDKLPHTPETLAEFREAQTAALTVPNTGMAVITDLVDKLSDIHPPYKWEVARRLSLWALAKDYGKPNLVYSGPRYSNMKSIGNKIEIEFQYTGSGLVSRDGQPLSWFTIAGKDRKFYPAQAAIEGTKVVVSAPEVNDPVAVRFAWDETAMPNLMNKEGLPAIPFRTDAPEWVMK